jgi:hypothetical protein
VWHTGQCAPANYFEREKPESEKEKFKIPKMPALFIFCREPFIHALATDE